MILLGIPPVATGKKTSCPSIDGRGNPVALEPPFVCGAGSLPFGVDEYDGFPCFSVVGASFVFFVGSAFLVGSGFLVGPGFEIVVSGAVGRPVIVGSAAWKPLSDRNQSIKPSNPKYGVLSGETPRTSRSRLVG